MDKIIKMIYFFLFYDADALFPHVWISLISCNAFSQIMSGEDGDKSQRQTSEEIEHHIGITSILHQSVTFVHEGREGGKTSAKACSEEHFDGWG